MRDAAVADAFEQPRRNARGVPDEQGISHRRGLLVHAPIQAIAQAGAHGEEHVLVLPRRAQRMRLGGIVNFLFHVLALKAVFAEKGQIRLHPPDENDAAGKRRFFGKLLIQGCDELSFPPLSVDDQIG